MANDGNTQAIQQKAAACQRALEDVLEGWAVVEDFSKRLKELGALSLEGSDYVQQLEQHLHQQSSHRGQARPSQTSSATWPSQTHSSPNNSHHPSCEATPSSLSSEEIAEFWDKRDQLLQGSRGRQESAMSAMEDVKWSLLRAKLEQLRSLSVSHEDPVGIKPCDHMRHNYDTRCVWYTAFYTICCVYTPQHSYVNMCT